MKDISRNLTMLCDFYELTMGNGYFVAGMADKIVYFDVFYRDNPDDGGYAIAAGLEQIIEYVNALRFDEEDIDYLRAKGCFSEEFLTYLKSIRFTGDIEWYPEEKVIRKLGIPVELTEREYLLFARLAKGRGECLTPATLYEDVWGEAYLASSSNTVIVHIANLRRKLEKEPSSPALIRTVWGKGYRID